AHGVLRLLEVSALVALRQTRVDVDEVAGAATQRAGLEVYGHSPTQSCAQQPHQPGCKRGRRRAEGLELVDAVSGPQPVATVVAAEEVLLFDRSRVEHPLRHALLSRARVELVPQHLEIGPVPTEPNRRCPAVGVESGPDTIFLDHMTTTHAAPMLCRSC